MQNNRYWYIAGLVVAVLIIAVLVYFFGLREAKAPTQSTTATSSASSLTIPGGTITVGTSTLSGSSLTQTQIQAQLQAALVKKEAGDYAGAAAIWQQLTVDDPGDPVPYANLGDLYMNFSKNYPKAEANYSKAIKLYPTGIDLYRNLYTIYVWQGDTADASSTIALGLKNNPGNQDLLYLQSQLKAQ